MKKSKFLLHLIFVLSVVFLCGCDSQTTSDDQKEYQLKQGYFLLERYSLQTMVVDSCEYLYAYTGGHTGYIFTHKGNCKLCRARGEKHY